MRNLIKSGANWFDSDQGVAQPQSSPNVAKDPHTDASAKVRLS